MNSALYLVDPRTLLAASAVVAGMFGPLVLLGLQRKLRYPGLAQLGWSLLLAAGICLVNAFRGLVPEALAVVIGNLCGLSSVVLAAQGLRRFAGRPFRAGTAWIAAAATLAVVLWLGFGHESLRGRLIAYQTFETSMIAIGVWPYLGAPPSGCRLSYRLTAVSYLTYVLAALTRALAAAFTAPAASIFTPTGPNVIYFSVLLLAMIGIAFSCLALAFERSAADLTAARRAESVARLTGAIAHYLNNQLTVIGGYADLLLAPDRLDLESARKVSAMRAAGDRMARLTDRLLTYAQSKMLQPRRFDLREWLDGLLPELAREAGPSITVSLDESPARLEAEADPVELQRVLLDLVRNAREAMPAGALRLGLSALDFDAPSDAGLGLSPGTYVCLTFGDNGPGMDDETLRHLFEPFYTTKGLAEFEGMSLASAHGLLRQSRGALSVTSAPAQGTTFRLYLPA